MEVLRMRLIDAEKLVDMLYDNEFALYFAHWTMCSSLPGS